MREEITEILFLLMWKYWLCVKFLIILSYLKSYEIGNSFLIFKMRKLNFKVSEIFAEFKLSVKSHVITWLHCLWKSQSFWLSEENVGVDFLDRKIPFLMFISWLYRIHLPNMMSMKMFLIILRSQPMVSPFLNTY